MAVLPPGISAEQFGSAIGQMQAAIGREWVFTSDEDLFPYRDPNSMIKDQPNELVASAAVGPDSVEQVQAIVRIANQFKIPLYAISTGKNYTYGGASPNVRGSIIVDLKRMNRVLEVDEDRHFALVEPGVSYFDLYRYIQERGLKVWIDCPDPGWGGLIGNALDRGIGYTMGFYRDHIGSHCGMEVVLANGEVMRTGMGGVPNTKSWQEYKHGFGPDPSGLFAQGNFGIVTKMGFRLMPQPEYWRHCLVTVPKRRDLIPLVKTVNYLSDLFMIGEPVYGSPLRQLMGNTEFREAATRTGGFDEAALDRMAAAANLHSWQVELQFYGSERTTLATWEYAQELMAKAVPGARMVDGEVLKIPLTRDQLNRTSGSYRTNIGRSAAVGVPELGAWFSIGRSEQDPNSWRQTHLGLFAVIPRTGEAVLESQQVFGDLMAELGLPSRGSALGTPVNWYQFAFEVPTGFGGLTDPAPESKLKQAEMVRRIIEVSASHGWLEYRAPPLFQDDIADVLTFGNHSLRRFNEAMKDAIDPNGILSPGRGGIWPKNYRSLRGALRK